MGEGRAPLEALGRLLCTRPHLPYIGQVFVTEGTVQGNVYSGISLFGSQSGLPLTQTQTRQAFALPGLLRAMPTGPSVPEAAPAPWGRGCLGLARPARGGCTRRQEALL